MKRISIMLFLCVWVALPLLAQTYKYKEIYKDLPLLCLK